MQVAKTWVLGVVRVLRVLEGWNLAGTCTIQAFLNGFKKLLSIYTRKERQNLIKNVALRVPKWEQKDGQEASICSTLMKVKMRVKWTKR